jgi:hypothetical protein
MAQSKHPLRRVYIVESDSMFCEGLKYLLGSEASLSVAGGKYTSTPAYIENIALDQPDSLLLPETEAVDSAYLLNLLLGTSSLAGMIVILAYIESNIVDVYKIPERADTQKSLPRHQVNVSNFEDLVALMRGDLFQSNAL